MGMRELRLLFIKYQPMQYLRSHLLKENINQNTKLLVSDTQKFEQHKFSDKHRLCRNIEEIPTDSK